MINGLLTYIFTYLNRATSFQIKAAVSAHYDDVAVDEAKKMLVDTVRDLPIDVKEAIKDRQNSFNRSAKEANLDDVIYIAGAIDKADIEEGALPVFCVSDLSKLPLAPPEASANLMSIYDIIAKQEKQLQQLAMEMATVRNEVSDMKKVPTRSFANVARMSSMATETGPPADRRGKPAVLGPSEEDSDTQDFQVVGPKKNRPKQNLASSRPQPKRGAADKSDILVAGPSKFTVQITNVNPDKDENDIKQYINGQNDNLGDIEVKDTSSEGWST